MKTFSNSEYRLFEQIVSTSQPVLMKTMEKFLKRHYSEVITTKDYICAIGDIPIALVAHLDTVFSKPPAQVYYDTRKNVIWSPQGLGADDRAGVFAIIKLIRMGYHPHIIFTTEEEAGAIGAKTLVKNIKQPFADIKYIIQLDRHGATDCVFYDCANTDFIQYVESFGFIEDIGIFSDISIICPAWKISGVNLSIGYKNEHSIAETFHVGYFFATLEKVVKMLEDAKNVDIFKYISMKSYYHFYPIVGECWGFLDKDIECAKCHNKFDEYEMFPVKMLTGETKFLCPDCLVGHVSWCDVCSEAFETPADNSEANICLDCRGDNKWKNSKIS